ncbi:MIP/aquaporin family protein [Streptomyces smyrnaeus]|uniref:MIP/aquaporin family protein n=1 Tax=Streptomyces TaxID=1883 RepID=UPI000C1A1872|nr:MULTISPECIES: MIP/aquaporin family protein [unclassified Streptomyces]MBQ0865880.1 aquaporin family protein [Streptomyces sp. RK75]MBQ1123301.1 aquaporin family protein [Streptomyces sp. B15]MBQ1157284.1 aquaporin family protein [Streptomyces sp. A73]
MAVEIQPLLKSSRLKRRGGLWGECLAEFLGTFVLVSFGCGVVAMAVAALPGSGRTSGPTTFFLGAGDWLLITWGWGMAVALGIYVAGGVSGAHINPAVTLGFAVRRKFPWAKVVPYWASQVLGALAGAALVYAVYHDAIDTFDAAMKGPKTGGHTLASFSIFGTFPAPYFNGGIWGPLIDQAVGTAFLVMLVVAIIDLRNTAVKANLGPLMIGFVVAAIGMSFGANAGYAINPARDFGPRLFTWMAGWKDLAFPGSMPGSFSGYWWIPIVGPLVGGVIGVLVYDLLIGDVLHLRAQRAEPPEPGRTRPTTSDEG